MVNFHWIFFKKHCRFMKITLSVKFLNHAFVNKIFDISTSKSTLIIVVVTVPLFYFDNFFSYSHNHTLLCIDLYDYYCMFIRHKNISLVNVSLQNLVIPQYMIRCLKYLYHTLCIYTILQQLIISQSNMLLFYKSSNLNL